MKISSNVSKAHLDKIVFYKYKQMKVRQNQSEEIKTKPMF